jgi:hypothetical protein
MENVLLISSVSYPDHIRIRSPDTDLAGKNDPQSKKEIKEFFVLERCMFSLESLRLELKFIFQL